MADARITLTSFNGGYLSKSVRHRKELTKVQNGLMLADNIQVRAFGGMRNRAGLKLAEKVKNSSNYVRLKVFDISGDVSAVVEAGPMYFRYITEGGYVVNGATIVETATPYDAEHLDRLFFSQSNDVATITNGSFAIRELSRSSAVTFTLSTPTFAPTVTAPNTIANTVTEGYSTVPTGEAKVEYDYAIGAIGPTGEESLLSASTRSAAVILGYAANYVDITWNGTNGDEIEYAIYKKEATSDFWGFIGRATSESFRDDNIAPLTSDSPQTGENPFTDVDMCPKISTFVQQRRLFSGFEYDKQKIWLSQSGSFKNFGSSVPSKETDAFDFSIASSQKQEIQHVVAAGNGMVVFTNVGEWLITGRDGDIMHPSSISPDHKTSWGSNVKIPPVKVGSEILFVTRNARRVRGIDISTEQGKFDTTDLTLMADDLFVSKEIVTLSYATEPDGIIYCVLNDGTCALMTYLKEHDVWGWTTMSTPGTILDCVVVKEETRDVPYFLIERYLDGAFVKTIEYLEDRDADDINTHGFFVDCGLTYDDPLDVGDMTMAADGELTVTMTGHGLSVGDLVKITNAGLQDKLFNTITDINGRYLVRAVTDANNFTIETEAGEDVLPYVGDVQLTVDEVRALIFTEGAKLRKSLETVFGFDHLANEDVVALADGNYIDGLTVNADGSLDFGEPVFTAHVGLPYVSRAQTLDLNNQEQNDEGVLKATPEIYVELVDTRGVEFGVDFDNMEALEDRSDEDYDAPSALITEEREVTFSDDYEREKTVCIRQTYPLPMEVVKITQGAEYGG